MICRREKSPPLSATAPLCTRFPGEPAAIARRRLRPRRAVGTALFAAGSPGPLRLRSAYALGTLRRTAPWLGLCPVLYLRLCASVVVCPYNQGRRARTPFRPRSIYVAGLLSVPALLPKSGVVPGLCPRPHYLSASAYRNPRRINAPALFGRCLRCRSSTIVVWSSLSALPCGMYVDKRLCSQAPRACTTDVVSTDGAPIPRPIMLKGPHFPFSLSPRLRRSRQRCGGQGRAVSPS